MADAEIYNMTVVRGTTPKFIFRFKQDGAGIAIESAILSVFKSNGKTLAFRVEMSITDAQEGEVRYTATETQTHGLTQSKDDDDSYKNSYEIEIRNGSDAQVYVRGGIRATGGLNTDAPATV